MTTSHWLRAHSFHSHDISTDVVILGGGYVGLSTAYWLTELKPDLKVTVVDRSFCGAGASGRNAGFLTIGSAAFYKSLSEKWGVEKALSICNFASTSVELAHQHILKVSPEVKFERTSSLTLLQNENQFLPYKNNFSPEQFGFNWKEEGELPGSLKGKFLGGLDSSVEYKINPAQLLASLKKQLESRKVTIIENASGFEILPNGIKTEVNTIKARQLVLALNAYFPQFHPLFKDIIIPRRAQMLAVEVDQELEAPHLYYDPPHKVYWRKGQDKVVLIGGKRLLDESGETGEFEKISPIIQNGLEEYLKQQLGLNYKIINRWSGIMGFSESELPLIGPIDTLMEAYMIGGFSGHGMGFGFNSAKDAAEIITGFKKESFFNQFKKPDVTL